eukprot:COSAG01_NODE_12367_length_1752_cov_1.408953_1_plen_105_part_00
MEKTTLTLKLDILLLKIKNTSLFFHQTFKALLEKIRTHNSNKKHQEEYIRELVFVLRKETVWFETWSKASHRKYPYLKKYIMSYSKITSDMLSSSFESVEGKSP